MNFISDIWNKAKRLNKTIVLPESEDPRILRASEIMVKSKLAKIILIGEEERIKGIARERGINPAGIRVINPAGEKPLHFGAELVKKGEADGMAAGAAHYTSEVIRVCLRRIGLAAGQTKLTSFFVMILEDKNLGEGGMFFFADCAVLPSPGEQGLAEIAGQTANSFRVLTGREPRVAMLARQPVAEALETANVLIFPDLDAGNIGYKITERLARAAALGPVLQGAARPVNDLSRGCSIDDIINVVAITAVQA